MRRVAILISGRGSNMSALIEAASAGGFPATIALVISNRADAPGLAFAAARGIAVAELLAIEARMKVLGQVSHKLRHSVSTMQDKSAQMRAGSAEQTELSDSATSIHRGGPLDQLQEAFYALKQQGVRLYLAILDNHSSKQLAIETEQLNLLVERIESTVSKMRAALEHALEQVGDAQAANPQPSPEVIEILNMDIKQVVRDLDLWQEEFDGLSDAVVELKREIKA